MTELSIVLADFDPADHYPPEDEENSALVLAIDCDTFTVIEHTGRFLHGSINCAGYKGIDTGIAGCPDEPGYWVMRNGTVIDTSHWEHPGTEFELQGDWAPAQPEDFARFGVELPAHYFPGIVDIVRFYSKAIKNDRSKRDVFDFAQDEMIELDVEIGLADAGSPPGEDGVFGEAIDGIACLLDLIFLERPDVTNEEISAYMQAKCEKWAKKNGA